MQINTNIQHIHGQYWVFLEQGGSMWDLHKTESAHVDRNKGRCYPVQQCESLQCFWSNNGAHRRKSCCNWFVWNQLSVSFGFLTRFGDIKSISYCHFHNGPYLLTAFSLGLTSSFISPHLHLSFSLSHRLPLHLSAWWKPIWESCRLGCLLMRPTTVPSPSCHLLVPLQPAAGLPTGQFRWSAVSCHYGHPPWLPLKDIRTVLVTSGYLLYTTLVHVGF